MRSAGSPGCPRATTVVQRNTQMSNSDAGTRLYDRPLLIESIVIMAFAATMFGVTFTFDRVPDILAQGIQPTVFPRAVLILMFGLAALQAIKAARLSPEQFAKLKPAKPVPVIVLTTTGLLIAFFLAMPVIGTFPTLILFCPALSYLWGERRWLIMTLSFSGFIAFIYVLFRLIMNVPLP